MTERGAAVVYRSLDPTVIDGYNAWRTRLTEWGDELRTEIDRYFPGKPILRRWGTNAIAFAGIGWTSEDGPVPDGWRPISGRGAPGILPKRNTKDGKAIAKRFAEIGRVDDPALPGMIREWWGEPTGSGFGFRIFYPSIHVIDGTLYVVWTVKIGGGDSMGNDTTKIDPALWVKVPLSEYHAAVEAETATAAT